VVLMAIGGRGGLNTPEMAIFRARRGPPLYKTGTRYVRDTYEPCTSLAQDPALSINSAYELQVSSNLPPNKKSVRGIANPRE
jgi:hypothetical protein